MIIIVLALLVLMQCFSPYSETLQGQPQDLLGRLAFVRH